MSEAERKKRQDYKRNRKKWITVQIVALCVLVVMTLGSFLIYDNMNRTYYIEYTENASADYKIGYVENEFFEEEWIGSGQSYISSLISGMRADFSYDLDLDASNASFEYTYGIKAHLIVSDKTTGNYHIEEVYELLPEKEMALSGADGFKIRESVYVDFNTYDDYARRFINEYGLKNAVSVLVLTLDVDVRSACDELVECSESSCFVSLNVPLAEETFSINMTQSIPDEDNQVLAYKGAINQNLFLIASCVLAVLALILAGVLVAFVYLTRNDDVNYTIRVRKLVNAYRSYIQEITTEFDFTGYQTIKIKTFTEMLGIRDTIQSPILMSENVDETMTQFIVPTNTKLLYVYEIKVDNYDDIYSVREENDNLIIEYTDGDEVEEAVIIEEGIELEDVAEAMASPDVSLDEIEYVADNDEDYEGTEDDPGVEVIGVVWPERAHKNKVYRYDPSGEQLTEGDMVLVPTRDAAREKDVIRKAAVAHGNHRIDPELLKHPLKKIIGVIKRRTETALSSEKNESDTEEIK